MEKSLVMLFGSFDGLHQGHFFFIEQAKKLGEKFVVVIAQDEIIKKIKGRLPKRSLRERIEALAEKYSDITIVESDTELGEWTVIKKYKPHIIALGYDQHGLKESLENSEIEPMPEIIVIDSHYPEKYKSSLI